MPFSTPYNRMHWHINIEQHKFGPDDLEAILMDLLSITVEGADYLGTPLVGPEAGVGGMGAQFILDAIGYNGAVNSFIRMLQPKKHGGFTSDEILAMGGAAPSLGMIVDLIDLASHASGWRVRFSP